MFDERRINAYKFIKAPPQLREKVLEQRAVSRRKTAGRKQMVSIAAGLLLIVGITAAVYGGRGGMAITMDGAAVTENGVALADTQSDPMIRMAAVEPMMVPLELELGEEATITCTAGELFVEEDDASLVSVGTSCSVQGEVRASWEIPAGDTAQTYTMTISGEKESVTLQLSYDMTAGCWVLCRSGNK